MKEKVDLVKMWIQKAENDLKTAKDELNTENPAKDTICFHAQQCAEKYLKAFLVYHEIEFEKTHVLEDLIALAAQIDNSFIKLIEFAKKLTPYAVEIRYPLFEEPTMEETQEAIKIAEEIKKFVLDRIHLKNKKNKNGI
jgi:HEPN domain-containing protein